MRWALPGRQPRVALLSDGEIVEIGSPADLFVGRASLVTAKITIE
jgi:hypothetical protein